MAEVGLKEMVGIRRRESMEAVSKRRVHREKTNEAKDGRKSKNDQKIKRRVQRN